MRSSRHTGLQLCLSLFEPLQGQGGQCLAKSRGSCRRLGRCRRVHRCWCLCRRCRGHVGPPRWPDGHRTLRCCPLVIGSQVRVLRQRWIAGRAMPTRRVPERPSNRRPGLASRPRVLKTRHARWRADATTCRPSRFRGRGSARQGPWRIDCSTQGTAAGPFSVGSRRVCPLCYLSDLCDRVSPVVVLSREMTGDGCDALDSGCVESCGALRGGPRYRRSEAAGGTLDRQRWRIGDVGGVVAAGARVRCHRWTLPLHTIQ